MQYWYFVLKIEHSGQRTDVTVAGAFKYKHNAQEFRNAKAQNNNYLEEIEYQVATRDEIAKEYYPF